MIIGIPKETKRHEYRVAMTPIAVRDLVAAGHTLLVERSAGSHAGWPDREYRDAGAKISTRLELFRRAEMVVKVKEPQPEEYPLLQPGQILFTFLHLAGVTGLIRALLKRKVIAIGYETVQTDDGRLPLLAPMSEIAGKIASLMGANFLRKDLGGKGRLLAGVGGKDRGRVLILGAGTVGTHAAQIAHGLGAAVTIFDKEETKLRSIKELIPERLEIRHLKESSDLQECLTKTDLLVGAVLIPGRRAPRLVTRSMVGKMEAGSVIMDVSIDQGGCVETSRPTTLDQPVFIKQGVLHCGVTNMPSLFPKSASEALSRATFPYVKKLADFGYERAIQEDPALHKGVNLDRGEIVLQSLLNDIKKVV